MQFIYHYVNIKNVNDGIIKITYYGSIFNVIVDEKDAVMSVKCLLVEPQGSHQVIIFKINDKIAKLVISGETKIKSGDTFFIDFKQEKIMFFDYESKLAI